MAYNEIETASREELRNLQTERLRETVRQAYDRVPFYEQTLDDAGVESDDITEVDDIERLPFTTKEDFRDEYPDGLFAVDWSDVRRIHASSGTTGKPKIVPYTKGDLEVWAEAMARSLYAGAVRPGDVVQNAYGYGLFTGGLGFHDGIEELGAAVIPTGSGGTARQIQLLEDLESDALACTPSYCLYLAEQAHERGVNIRDLPVSTVLIGAEPFTDPMREEIERELGVTAVDVYGLSEIIGPGVSIECADVQEGLHLWEDLFYPEIIDPETCEVLPPGEEGELVLTTLTKEALPVLRYRTGDITRLNYNRCECGRTAVRMGNVTGRTDDLLIIRGVNVYPSQIEAVMVDIEAVAPQYRIDLYREGNVERVEITVEHHQEFTDVHGRLKADIEARLEDALDVRVDELSVVSPGVIERTETGKVRRVYDHRDK